MPTVEQRIRDADPLRGQVPQPVPVPRWRDLQEAPDLSSYPRGPLVRHRLALAVALVAFIAGIAIATTVIGGRTHQTRVPAGPHNHHGSTPAPARTIAIPPSRVRTITTAPSRPSTSTAVPGGLHVGALRRPPDHPISPRLERALGYLVHQEPTVRLRAARLVLDRHGFQIAVVPTAHGACISDQVRNVRGRWSGGGTCTSTDSVNSGGLSIEHPCWAGQSSWLVIAGVAPDDARRAELTLRGKTVASVTVRDNAYLLSAPSGADSLTVGPHTLSVGGSAPC